jgi:hypothetical protein
MIKFLLIMQICSLVEKECLPPIKDTDVYSTYYECSTVGYLRALKIIDEIGEDLVNQVRIQAHFTCKEVNEL